MIIHDTKKAITSIMAKRHPKDGTVSSAPMKSERPTLDESGEVDGRHAAAEDVIAAMSEKSPQRLMEAMANFHDLHLSMANKGSSSEG